MNNPDTDIRARRIIEGLKTFNRKERDHLMKFALCENPEEPKISSKLWDLISRENETNPPPPEEMFVGMDYHLNWIHAALASSVKKNVDSHAEFENEWQCTGPSDCKDKNFRPIQENQEDVDLLVAWVNSRSKRLELVFVEAKLDSGWLSEQVESKLKRLSLIRDDAINRSLEFIDWSFLLLAPKAPSAERSKKIKSILADERYAWAKEHDSKEPKFWHEPWKLPNGRAAVNRVSRNWARWEISSRD